MFSRFAHAFKKPVGSLIKSNTRIMLPVFAPEAHIPVTTPFSAMSTLSTEATSAPAWYITVNTVEGPISRKTDFNRQGYSALNAFTMLVEANHLQETSSCEVQVDKGGVRVKILEIDSASGELTVFDQELTKKLFSAMENRILSDLEARSDNEFNRRCMDIYSTEIADRLASAEMAEFSL